MKKKYTNKHMAIVVMVVAAFAIFVTVMVLQNQQDTRSDASRRPTNLILPESSNANAIEKIEQLDETLEKLETLSIKPRGASVQQISANAKQLVIEQEEIEKLLEEARVLGFETTDLLLKLQEVLGRQKVVLTGLSGTAPAQARSAINDALQKTEKGLERVLEALNQQ